MTLFHTLTPVRVVLFFAPMALLPLGLGVFSIFSWSPALDRWMPAPSEPAPAEANSEIESATPRPWDMPPASRAYVTFIPSIDVLLPAGNGRLKAEIAFAVDRRHIARISDGIPQDPSPLQHRLIERALALADTLASEGRLGPDLEEFRRVLPEALTDAMNAELRLLELPESVLEVLITDWRVAPSSTRQDAP